MKMGKQISAWQDYVNGNAILVKLYEISQILFRIKFHRFEYRI